MAYLSLYRKYRPQKFAELAGQAPIATALATAVRLGKTVHAYLFTGPRGTGKTTTARILAKALNCEKGPTPEPCGVCDACKSITEGTALDVLELDAASNRGIDEVRSLREQTRYTPTSLKHKVYILDEAHELTKDAANALLKTLEEPPERTMFILCTTEPHKLLATIRSRCQHYGFRRVRADEVADLLAQIAEKESIRAERDALLLIARLGEGSLRDAIGLLDQLAVDEAPITLARVVDLLGLTEEVTVAQFAETVLAGDWAAAMQQLDALVIAGRDVRYLLEQLTEHFRAALLIKFAPAVAGELPHSPDYLAALRRHAERADQGALRRILKTLAEAEKSFTTWGNPRLAFELTLLEVCQAPTEAAAPAADYAPPRRAAAPAVHEDAPAPTLPAAPRAPAPSDGPTLAYFQENWPALLGDIKERLGATAIAFLRDAEPIAWRGQELTLAFTKQFNRDATDKSDRRSRIEATLTDLVGAPVTLRGIVRAPDAQASDAIAAVLQAFPGSEVVTPK